jgi:hypothetical protein
VCVLGIHDDFSFAHAESVCDVRVCVCVSVFFAFLFSFPVVSSRERSGDGNFQRLWVLRVCGPVCY